MRLRISLKPSALTDSSDSSLAREGRSAARGVDVQLASVDWRGKRLLVTSGQGWKFWSHWTSTNTPSWEGQECFVTVAHVASTDPTGRGPYCLRVVGESSDSLCSPPTPRGREPCYWQVQMTVQLYGLLWCHLSVCVCVRTRCGLQLGPLIQPSETGSPGSHFSFAGWVGVGLFPVVSSWSKWLLCKSFQSC